VCGFHSRSGRITRKKNFLSLSGIEPWFLSWAACFLFIFHPSRIIQPCFYSSLVFITINITSSSSSSQSSFPSSLNILPSRKYFYSSLSSPYTQYYSYLSPASSYSFLYFPTVIYPSVCPSPTFGVFSLHKYLLRVLRILNLHKIKVTDSCEMTRNNGLPGASEL